MQKKWQILPKIDSEFINKFPEINQIALQLLYNRGLKDQEIIDDFLNPNYDDHILDPFLFHDMEKGINRLFQALKNQEKVMIYGDYDADGVCATAILYEALKGLGLEVETYIPFRETEGYGLNEKIVQQIIHQRFDLVITVDCGIANATEIDLFNKSNIDVIILDHHQEPPKLPKALAIINPSIKDSGYPFSDLCGAGVTFKFVQAIMLTQEKQNTPIKLPTGFDKWLLDLTAIATVGDIMPLLNENRVIVKYGLMVLAKNKRVGLTKMIEAINNKSTEIDTQYLGWRLVPRLNAAGRIDNASVAFDLLTIVNGEEAERLVQLLENNNRERQQITEKMMKEAESQIGEVKDQKILWAIGDDWPAGVVGLVAGRLCDRYHRPVLAISKKEDKYVGSGRSIAEFDITAALGECQEFSTRFGGHSQACGFTVISDDNFKKFKEKLTQIAEKKLKDIDLRPTLEVEAEIGLKDIGWPVLEDLEKFEPFGQNNNKPLFVAYKLTVEQVQTVGADGKHLRVMVSQDEHPEVHKLIGFSFGDWCARLNTGDKIDIVFELGINEWNGNREIQLKIIDLKLSNQ